MRTPSSGTEPCIPIQANGTVPAASGAGRTLIAAQTYYAELGGLDASQMGILLHGAAALVLTHVTLEVTNSDTADILSTTAGDWFAHDPSDATVEVTGNMAGATVDISKTAAAIGTALIHLPTFPWRRGRLAIVVGAAGGVLTSSVQSKE